MRRRNVDESRRARERELLAAQPTYGEVQRYAVEVFRGSPDPYAAGLEVDRVVKQTGYAGQYYAERLLAMIPPAWRTGGRVTSPYPIDNDPSVNFYLHGPGGEGWSRHQIPELVHFVDRAPEYRDKAQLDRFLTRSRVNLLKPYLAINTPDGFGDPSELRTGPGSDFGSSLRRMTTIGIEIGYRAGLTQRSLRRASKHYVYDSDDYIELSGAGELEIRGAHYYGLRYLTRSGSSRYHKLRPEWTNKSFLKLAATAYDGLLERARGLGPVAALTQREEEARRHATGNYPDMTPEDWGFADSERGQLDQSLIRLVTRAGEIAGLPEFPWGSGRRSGVNVSDYTPGVLARWHRILDALIPTHYHPSPREAPPFSGPGDQPLDAEVL